MQQVQLVLAGTALTNPGLASRLGSYERREAPLVRFVIYGLGAIGGVLAARLHLAGLDVLGIARGQQLTAVQRDGLRLETPEGSVKIDLPVVADPRQVACRGGDDVAVIAVKSQHTESAVRRSQPAPRQT